MDRTEALLRHIIEGQKLQMRWQLVATEMLPKVPASVAGLCDETKRWLDRPESQGESA